MDGGNDGSLCGVVREELVDSQVLEELLDWLPSNRHLGEGLAGQINSQYNGTQVEGSLDAETVRNYPKVYYNNKYNHQIEFKFYLCLFV